MHHFYLYIYQVSAYMHRDVTVAEAKRKADKSQWEGVLQVCLLFINDRVQSEVNTT